MELNGLSLEGLQEMLRLVGQQEQKVKELSSWRARIRWNGGFKCTAYIRRHMLKADEPSDLAGVDVAPNAVEYLLAALGFCVAVGFVYNATRKGVRIEDLELSVAGRLENVLKFLRLSEEGSPGYGQIELKVYVRAQAPKEELARLLGEAIETSPVAQSLIRGVRVSASLEAVD
ncbi:MAG: osmotically inducible protein OsmC [Nitrososphaerota archaeon]